MTRVVILGGGFGGVYTATHLQRLWRDDPSVSITLVSRVNYFLVTPLLFEASSGVLDPRHVVSPIRRMLDRAQFFEADVEGVDFERRVVRMRHDASSPLQELPYDQLVIAVGGVTNTQVIPGSENALYFKSLADAIYLRNHIIDTFERATLEQDPVVRQRLMTLVVIGAGLVGVELMGELTQFVHDVCRHYPNLRCREVRFHLIEAGPRVLPEMEQDQADYVIDVLQRRRVNIRTNTPAERIAPNRLHLGGGETIEAGTIILAAGIAPNPLLATLDLEKDKRGRLVVDATMRSRQRPEVWALGDCASVPDPQGKPYASLAQHALRQARVLAGNITAAIRGQPLEPFVYETMGMLAALGHRTGVGRVWKVRVRGFLAWWVWRSYYLWQMPRWERRLRIVIDWTIALLFRYDVVKLELFGARHPRVGAAEEAREDGDEPERQA